MDKQNFDYDAEIQDAIKHMKLSIWDLRRIYIHAFKDRKVDLCRALRNAYDAIDTAIFNLDSESFWDEDAQEASQNTQKEAQQ